METVNLIIADDHEIFRKGLEFTLKRVEYIDKIYHASNGKEVLKLLNDGKQVDVIIMDIRMPEMDGIETTRLIRMKYMDVKIIALSMMNDKASIVQMMKAGANGYLLKNTNKIELQDAIDIVMKGQRYFTSEASNIMFNADFGDPSSSQKSSYPITDLSPRELDVLRLICHQYNTKEISEILCLAEKSIEGHRKSLLEKTSSRNIAGLVWYALQNGIIRGAKE